MRCASCLEAKGRTRMALLLCNATMMYWLPLRARGWKRPVSSVKMCDRGSSWSSTVLAARAGPWAVSPAGGEGDRGLVDRMCWRGCAM